MDEEMNLSEELVKQTEEKTLYKVLLIIKESISKDEVEEKVKALLNK